MAFADTDNLLLIPMPASGFRGLVAARRSQGNPVGSVFVADDANESVRQLFDGRGPFGVDHWPGWFTPLVLFGPTGSGKTSLAWTIANCEFMNRRPGTRLDCTGADFARMVAEAIDSGTTDQLAARMESASAIVIDDLHRLENYPVAQGFLVSVLDSLVELQVPLITTLPEDPGSTSLLGDALTSRLRGGLTVPIRLPGPAARLGIVDELGNEFQLEMDSATKSFLVDRFPVSAGQLRRVFSTMAIHQQARNSRATIDIEAVSKPVRFASRNPRFQMRLVDAVASRMGVTARDILGTSRQQSTVLARGVLVYLLRTLFDWSFSGIGGLLRGKDHSTVLHAFRKISGRIADDSAFAADVQKLEAFAGELLVNHLPENPADETTGDDDDGTPGKPVHSMSTHVGSGRRC